MHSRFVSFVLGLAWIACMQPMIRSQDSLSSIESKRAERKEFQSLELFPARQGAWIFPLALPPKLIWRDAEGARKFGYSPGFVVRWFGPNLQESTVPDQGGRWIALVEGTAPNQTPMRRGFTFYAIPNDIAASQTFVPDLTVELPHFPGPQAPESWHEHQREFDRSSKDLLIKSLMDHEQGAILVAGIAETKDLGRPKRFHEWTPSVNSQRHLDLKLQRMGIELPLHGLNPPRQKSVPSTVIRSGTCEEAGVPAHAKRRIDSFCEEWVKATKEPFVTLVAKNGVIITHASYGAGPDGLPIGLDYRCWVASITKTVTSILFSQFVDQGLIELDWTLDRVFPDYPAHAPSVPTFRQLLNHTSGLSGHGDWGGMFNPYLENIVLNGIDVNEPGKKHEYCGLGFELVGKAMEIKTGKCAARIYYDHLFAPFGMQNVIMGNASSDGEFTAMELAILGQWLANQGSYGDRQFIDPKTFAQMLPSPSGEEAVAGDHGLGLHRIRHRRVDADPKSKGQGSLLFSENAFGHGSFSGCILVVDPDQQLVIVQARKRFQATDNTYWARFFQVVADAINDGTEND
ncbi:serine hydrolase domain-containing protein [Pirellula sp. SH-Sr6A]|uniref:serine hydrolase domain-containing protein n=1 Tax=Pirellula sp. SH-Sr6A TaxID=1632865 RepID=UPI00143A9F49|nr:serine hydrolase domain-containing protein [Pirellula sp. SH-Sr6A]